MKTFQLKLQKLISYISLFVCFACTPKSMLLEIKKVSTQISKLDSLYRYRESKLFQYEKLKIDSTYNRITDDDLLLRINTLTRPKN